MVIEGQRAASAEGCLRCHSLDGSAHLGPTWAGLFESRVRLQTGEDLVADGGYLTASMVDPQAMLHAGFPPMMPSYSGKLRAEDIAGLLELIRSLRDVPRPGDVDPGPAGEAAWAAPGASRPPNAGRARPPAGLPALPTPGIRSWLLTTDHKRIGVMFYGVLVMLFIWGVFAFLIRAELLTPERTFIEANAYNRMFTLHGDYDGVDVHDPRDTGRVRQFRLADHDWRRDLAFPRINLASFYVYLIGCAFTMAAMLWGGVDTGWTFYVPYSTYTPSAVVLVVTEIPRLAAMKWMILSGPWIGRSAACFRPPPSVINTTFGAIRFTRSVMDPSWMARRNCSVTRRCVSESTGFRGAVQRDQTGDPAVPVARQLYASSARTYEVRRWVAGPR